MTIPVPKKVFLVGVFLALLCGFQTSAYAIFQLTVQPRRGGQNLHIEQTKPGQEARNEEETITVQNTNAGAQYQIFQTIYQPLTNEFGNTIPQNALVMFSPSTTLGTLKPQLETPVTMGQVPIYTSNAAGDSDTFVLVYHLTVPPGQAGGNYHTTITYTAQPLSGAASAAPSIVTIDLSVEIRPTFRLILQNPGGGHSLNFPKITKDRPTSSQTLDIHIDSNIGTTFRILQQVTEPILSSEGLPLDEENIQFEAAANSGKTVPTGTLSTSPTVLYTATDSGASDDVRVQYTVSPAGDVKAGIYTGNLSIKVESNSPLVPPDIYQIPIRIEIEPIFYLDVDTPMGLGGFHFGTFKTGDEKQDRQVFLTIHSNLGRPYQVTQIVSRKLMNQEGSAIPSDDFQWDIAGSKTGILKAPSLTPVQEGETVLFTSDNKGTPEKLTLTYSLAVPKDARAGSYSSDIRYSITTL